MQSGVKVALWALTGVLAVCTLLSNSYILFASLAAWRQQQRKGGGGGGGGATGGGGGGGRGPGETITAALSLACCAHQLACYLWMTMDEVDRHCRLALNGYTATLLLAYSFKFTALWDSALLTYYYCSKLVRGPGPGGGGSGPPGGGCSRLQAAVLSHTTAAVLLVLLLGLGTCLPMFAVFQPENSTATAGAANQDCGVLVAAGGSALLYEVAYILLADVLPGALMVRCCVSISTHLAAHLRNMKAHSGGEGDVARRRPRLGAQMRVIRMALSLVAVFAVFLAVDLYVQYQITVHHENIISLAFFFTSVYTAAAAAVLVYGRRSLWKALIHDLNGLLDEFPCLSCLKLPEQRDAARTAAMGATVVKL